MSKLRLTYFDGRGSAELSRLILAHAGVDFEDRRIAKEEWADIKPTTPFGQLPVLTRGGHDGDQLAQSLAIARYLAKEHNLAGKDNWEQAKADMVVDALADVVNKLMSVMHSDIAKDAALLSEAKSKLLTETMTPFLRNVEKILEANGGKHLVGQELTWADLAVAHGAHSLCDRLGSDLGSVSGALAEFAVSVFATPNIRKWIESRPETNF